MVLFPKYDQCLNTQIKSSLCNEGKQQQIHSIETFLFICKWSEFFFLFKTFVKDRIGL